MAFARRLLVGLLTALSVALGASGVAGCTNGPATGPQPTPTLTPKDRPTSLAVGVGDLPPGFNPHLLADRSPVTTALSTLVLPSPFRVAADGTLQLDPTVATSAHVVETTPFTVSYDLNLAASWSDNAPIAAEDFVYLWQQMRSQPGVADAGAYQLITDVRSRAGGKAVDVVFAQPYPSWQQLFAGLLPAHLLKDAPGSWIGATAGGLPTSGGPFKVATVDRGRGEIVLARNDAYWDTPTVLDQLVLRRLGPASMIAGLGTGDIDVALPDAARAARTAVAGLAPAPHVQQAPQPSVVQLAMRADSGPLRDVRVRAALAKLIDRDALRAAVAPDALPADALGLAPSQPGYAPTAPPTAAPDPTGAAALLDAVGWKRDLATGRWDTADGRPARIVIGAAADRPDDVRVAEAVAAQLTATGVDTLVVAPQAADLFAQPTVAPTPPSSSSTATASSTPTAATAGSSATVPNPTAVPADAPTRIPTPTPATATAPSTAPTSTVPATGVEADLVVTPRAVGGDLGTGLAGAYGCPTGTAQFPDPPRAPTGFCFAALQPLFAELMSSAPRVDTAAAVEQILWEQLPALPLFQPVTLVVSTAATDTATQIGPGSLLGGPLTGASRWRPTAH